VSDLNRLRRLQGPLSRPFDGLTPSDLDRIEPLPLAWSCDRLRRFLVVRARPGEGRVSTPSGRSAADTIREIFATSSGLHRLPALAPPSDRNDGPPPRSATAAPNPPFQVEHLGRRAEPEPEQELGREQRDVMAGSPIDLDEIAPPAAHMRALLCAACLKPDQGSARRRRRTAPYRPAGAGVEPAASLLGKSAGSRGAEGFFMRVSGSVLRGFALQPTAHRACRRGAPPAGSRRPFGLW